MKFRIRPMVPGDAERVAALERACNPMPWTAEALRPYAGEGGAETRKLGAVAEIGGEVAGYLCAHQGYGEAEILAFGVEPGRRRRGAGGALLAHVMDLLRSRRCGAVFLEVRRGNLPALSLYRAAGFREVGVRKGYFADTGEDAVLMRRDVPEQSGT